MLKYHEAMKMTQTELAKKCGISQSALANVLSGRRKPSVRMAIKLESGTGKHRLFWLYPEEFDEKGKHLK